MKKQQKKYPISIAKYDHTMMYLKDVATQKGRFDLAEEVDGIRRMMHRSSTDGRIGWLPGKTYERVRELAIAAQSYQDAVFKSRHSTHITN